MNALSTPQRIGRPQPPDHIVPAPMTRSRADDAAHVDPLDAGGACGPVAPPPAGRLHAAGADRIEGVAP